ncbi:similar to Saccharomyces cerevisiae YGL208W SIP2 One of three beta subunits of the Snf1 serine/threonine protein kinase complex involved in the response to glucose starvation [Maudiozyma saulgeensis]|uniref:Similar to Saccharomyces cerevisiae YGL208W SIP2 One of three beta subunits of the Snf1 serine/threonine protein kinase complex involved in the response to glucose starvation n=1 Tax=Maudiozyma saulgeensis TaxID=1789683 RepID=A0A1X7R426_9SACH|nr:similar to Saccharomyces cerevisiae YGL208W SIP2 One of three beta subunits of the Snf1 serine/threonine protein kinase complex involved in the response to glucose starvation [Kazachstania saulgeensis]
MQNKDTSMIDINDANNAEDKKGDTSLVHSFSQMSVDTANGLEPRPQISGRQRSRSTLIFDDDDEIPPYTDHQEHGSSNISDSDIDENSSGNDSDAYMNDDESLRLQPSNEQDRELKHQDQQIQMQMQMQPDEQQQQQQQQQQYVPPQNQQNNVMVPVDITWQQGGQKAYVTGSFTGWRKMIGLVPVPGQPGILHVKLQLPPGTHRFRFIVDNELRFSDYLPTATDQMGNFVNYLEVVAPNNHVASQNNNTMDDNTNWPLGQEQKQTQGEKPPLYKEEQNQTNRQTASKTERKEPMSARSRIALEIESEPDDMGNGFSRFHSQELLAPKVEYTQDIPAVFTDPTVMEQYYLTLDQQQNNHQNMAWLTPPQLPPHLENVILNSYSNSQGQNSENTSGALPIPNHVILNHLATSSIKHNTLCVASIVRYKQKYVTQILYAPLQ